MDFDKIKEALGVFWTFTTGFILVSIASGFIVIYYLSCFGRVNHLKAKGPVNLLIIFLAGQFQSWGHYMYSLPVYLQHSDDILACLIVGYLIQHLLGTTLLFYALVSRLIKFGMVFKSFDCFGTDARNTIGWTRFNYIKRLNKRYRFAILGSFIIVVLPICVFMFGVYKWHTITVDDNQYCITDQNWKIAFVSINTFYFLILGIFACFVPRKIEDDYFNEAGALVQSIAYSIFVFLLEIWISFGNDYSSLTWTMVSNSMVFSIHFFIIYRIFGYRAYKSIIGDQSYSENFKKNSRMRKYDQKDFHRIVLNPRTNDPLLSNFLAYVQINLAAHELEINNPIGNIKGIIRSDKLVRFINLVLKFEEELQLDVPERKKALFTRFKDIKSEFITSNLLPMTEGEVIYFERVTEDTLKHGIFIKYMALYLSTVYTEYFRNYINSDEASKVSHQARNNTEITVGITDMMGYMDKDETDYEVMLGRTLLEKVKSQGDIFELM